ncbi:tetratricopeptide repeat protein [Bacillus clarus]|uniref:Tetratricopeptide repeat family protein n=1 Tax=Bacillus clarus TaxID=2338372 RepID=A0A090YX64_9BACI|nr:tetratricopeptide repeat protein [Bacillus clarus]KFN02673.1 tetratricopeptide repeat family protein [Bacillus clarus]RFT66718.1 tetratricopeptide repeat protein [Bacillus clarus]
MSISIKNERITKLLNEWYLEMRSRNRENAYNLKKQVDETIHNLKIEKEKSIDDQELLLYYSLLNFRYKYLVDNMSISKDSFRDIESFEIPKNSLLGYYYHFFKAIHTSVIGDYKDAREHFDTAESLLTHVSDELEKAEFHYKLGSFYYDTYQGLLSIKQVTIAKEIYLKHSGCETNITFCENMLGLACTHLKEWELAEEHFTTAMDQFQKMNVENYILMVRHNLGLLYAGQNLSQLAIRYLQEVNKKPGNYRALLIEAKEHFKIKEHDIAAELIRKGLEISKDLKLGEYIHRFMILDGMNKNLSTPEFETLVLAGKEYFEKEDLYTYIHESLEVLAVKYYKEGHHLQASEYFYLSKQARDNAQEMGALK